MDKESELVVPNEVFNESVHENGGTQEGSNKPLKNSNKHSIILLTLAIIALAICLAGVAFIAASSLEEVKQLQEILKQYKEISISDKAAQIDNNIATSYQSWLLRTAQIENAVNANQQIILNRAAQIERNLSANEQSWQSRANQIEANYQSLLNNTDQIEKRAAANFRNIKQQLKKNCANKV